MPTTTPPDFDEELVLDQLEAFDVNTRKLALQTLALQGERAASYASSIAKLLGDDEAEVRKAAAQTLAKVGPKAGREVFSLVSSLRDFDDGVRAEAARAIGAMGPEVGAAHAEKVAALAKDREEAVSLAAVECLAAVGQASRLGGFLCSASPSVCRAALIEVARCPVARQTHAALVAERLTHPDVAVRLAAAHASGEIGAVCSEAHLLTLGRMHATERQVKVRRAAVQALGKIGRPGVPSLVAFFSDPDEAVRHFAAETLGGVGGEAAAQGAAEELTNPEPAVRRAALLALGKMKEAGRAHAATVAEHLHDADFASRLAAIQALSDLCAKTQAKQVGALAADASKGVRQAAVSALAKMGAEGAEEALGFLEDEDPAVRQAAVRVFSPLHSKLAGSLARPHAPAVVLRLLDSDWRVRFAAVVALGDLKADEYVNEVGALHKDDNNQVRRSAVTTLEKLGAPAALVAHFLGDEDKATRQDAERVYAALRVSSQDEGELSEAD